MQSTGFAKKRIDIYDTTLRDGSQAEDVSFSMEDKLKIAKKLSILGIHYIEGGWPGANPKDSEFFKKAVDLNLGKSTLAAFGSTRKADIEANADKNLNALVDAKTSVVTIVGKAWDFHVEKDLKTTLEENLAMIADSIAYLKSKGKKVFFDPEHFFDGFKHNPDYAKAILKKAYDSGVDVVALCDTNGGCLPFDMQDILSSIATMLNQYSWGIHTHNDSENAVANSLIAVSFGASQVQGTINGIGERCGNANLCSIIPNLMLKMNIPCIPVDKLRLLKEVSDYVFEIANFPPNKHLAFVGESAFAHKGGLHASAVSKDSITYEHIDPSLVGNTQRILVSDLSGRSNIAIKAKQLGINIETKGNLIAKVTKTIKDLEHDGYHFEVADGSLELLLRKAMNPSLPKFFNLIGFRVIDDKKKGDEHLYAEATVMLEVDGSIEHTAAVGNGPVNALDHALSKALKRFYPILEEVRLLDYKVRVLTPDRGTAAKVRVLIECGDGVNTWITVGVSENVIEASWKALIESIELKLLRNMPLRKNVGI